MAVFSPIQLIASIPPVTRTFAAATVSLSLFYFYLQWRTGAETQRLISLSYLAQVYFIPGLFFTSVFVETSIIEVCP
jgi:hypothetical protein